MDFLRRLDPGRARTAAAARPALSPLMASMPVPSLAPLSSRPAASYAQPEGIPTPPHEARRPPRQAAPPALFDGPLRAPFQAAPATPDPQAKRALEPPRPLAQAAPLSTVQNLGGPLRGPPAEPLQVPDGPLEFTPLGAPRRAGTVEPSRHGRAPLAAPGQPLSAAALQAHASAAPDAIAAPAPALHVTIDRIEVRAAAPAPKPALAQRQPKPPAVSLADYLRSGARSKAAP